MRLWGRQDDTPVGLFLFPRAKTFAHRHLGFVEVYKYCEMLADMTGKTVDPTFIADAVHRLMTD